MRKLQVDIDQIAAAMEDHSGWTAWYLDTQTGEVIPRSETEGEEDELVEESERYEPVPQIPSREIYDLMAEFADGVEDLELRQLLSVALDGPGAFGRFKRVLGDYPEVRDGWFRLRDEYMAQEVGEWLRSLGIEPVERRYDE